MFFSEDVAMHNVLFLLGFFDIRFVNSLLRVFGVTVAVGSDFCLLVSIHVHHYVVNTFILL